MAALGFASIFLLRKEPQSRKTFNLLRLPLIALWLRVVEVESTDPSFKYVVLTVGFPNTVMVVWICLFAESTLLCTLDSVYVPIYWVKFLAARYSLWI